MSLDSSILVYADRHEFIALSEISRQPLERGPDAATVINAALARLEKAGGLLRLLPGSYPLSRPLHPSSRTRIAGCGEATRLLVNAETDGIYATDIHHLTLSDLSFESAELTRRARSGVRLERSADLKIDRVTVSGFADHGIHLVDTTLNARIINCTAADNQGSGFFFDRCRGWKDAPYGDFPPNSIIGCSAYHGGTGFRLKQSLLVNLIGCFAYQTAAAAFWIGEMSNSTLVSGCRAFETGEQGVFVEDSSEINVSSSIFCWQKGHGIEVRNSTWGTISANCVMDSGASAEVFRDNIHLHTDVKGYSITGNALFSWADQRPTEYGVFVDDTCRDVTVVANAINYYTKKGLAVAGEACAAAHNVTQKIAFPNPDVKPFARPDANYGIWNAPFDRTRLETYIATISARPPPA